MTWKVMPGDLRGDPGRAPRKAWNDSVPVLAPPPGWGRRGCLPTSRWMGRRGRLLLGSTQRVVALKRSNAPSMWRVARRSGRRRRALGDLGEAVWGLVLRAVKEGGCRTIIEGLALNHHGEGASRPGDRQGAHGSLGGLAGRLASSPSCCRASLLQT
ncbi:hypothetical protein HJG60_008401 [Phyllostomus discolor]|uniref:Uncharacterized protein n=1 Tax=Phyllostomus discolor TaxID=89673 RepID=A0A833Z725_9CHIR|nr:hypothetical protein HJG60_008401 [Phyllostomus discolor]